jgi:leucyl aminopeptidase
MTTISFTARHIRDAASAGTQCAVVPVFTRKSLSAAAGQLDKASRGAISDILSLGDFSGKKGETRLMPGAGSAKRVLLVGCGDRGKFDRAAARAFTKGACSGIAATQAKDATIHTGDLEMKDADSPWLMAYLARQLVGAGYRYRETLSDAKPAMALRKVVINTGSGKGLRGQQRALDLGRHTGTGVNEARDLANMPANICTPSHLARVARKLAREHDQVSVQVLDEKKMRELKMGALLAVTAGSAEPARMIIINYRGASRDKRPYVLVGKGVTFDTGGISIKPSAKMDEMKYDMAGGASVIGALRSVAEMGLPLNVIGVIPAVENMPGGMAIKPGDVVTSMSGKTIEILNTDAEGRLILCDALTYVERYKPQAVIDIATLTGACVVALGAHASGLYANNDKLAEQLLDAGVESHDRGWRMPLWDEYQEQLKSNFADIPNIASPGAGSVTAACFLARFTEKYHWAHLDIAGSAWDAHPKGATGRPVAMLVRYLLDRAGKQALR